MLKVSPLVSGLISSVSKARCILQIQSVLFRRFSTNSHVLDDITRDRIDGYVKLSDVVVFMKGTQEQPLCGFSMNVKRVIFYLNTLWIDDNFKKSLFFRFLIYMKLNSKITTF